MSTMMSTIAIKQRQGGRPSKSGIILLLIRTARKRADKLSRGLTDEKSATTAFALRELADALEEEISDE